MFFHQGKHLSKWRTRVIADTELFVNPKYIEKKFDIFDKIGYNL